VRQRHTRTPLQSYALKALRLAAALCSQAQRAAEEAQREYEASRLMYAESPRDGFGSGACGGLFPAAGVGQHSVTGDDSTPSTPLPELPKIREAASVSRIKGSGYGSINVRGGA
jgi:hypothetical protein